VADGVPITVAYGDGIGPEIMSAVLPILQEAGARLAPEVVEIGEQVYLRRVTSGIDEKAWESIRRTRVFLKAPITTPQGGGHKSLNVTVRVALGLFANVRPAVAYHPFVRTRHPGMNLVVVRENEEDLYAGIEHRQTADVTQSLKLISRPASERIIRYAFDYAVRHNRAKVTCFTKDNIMKLSDGLFHRVFDQVAGGYPQIEAEHWIVDIGAAKLADSPENFDVLVLPNLYGDILSDVAAQIAGSVGMAGAANIGEHGAMFEAIHGSAPRRAGQDLANPSGLLHGAIMMLVHVRQPDIATLVHNAWLRTIEEGIHTYDVHQEGRSKRKVGTAEFGRAVAARLGRQPERLAPVSYPATALTAAIGAVTPSPRPAKETVGVDVFFDWSAGSPADLAALLGQANGDGLRLTMISNRGVKVWPGGFGESFLTDHWRCRFLGESEGLPVAHRQIVGLLSRIAELGLDFVKTEHLCTFDGEPGYSLAQGE
jgi:isocitrate dehydrogenase